MTHWNKGPDRYKNHHSSVKILILSVCLKAFRLAFLQKSISFNASFFFFPGFSFHIDARRVSNAAPKSPNHQYVGVHGGKKAWQKGGDNKSSTGNVISVSPFYVSSCSISSTARTPCQGPSPPFSNCVHFSHRDASKKGFHSTITPRSYLGSADARRRPKNTSDVLIIHRVCTRIAHISPPRALMSTAVKTTELPTRRGQKTPRRLAADDTHTQTHRISKTEKKTSCIFKKHIHSNECIGARRVRPAVTLATLLL